jgi:hypothetical protein
MRTRKNMATRPVRDFFGLNHSMSVGVMISRCGLAGLAILAGANVASAFDDASNPYSVIVDRNVFHLNPAPPPAAPDKGPPPDLPKVYLSGFMRTGDKLKVLLAVKTKDPKSKPPETSSYLTLEEGSKEGVVELVRAYADEGKVDIINSGTPMTLSLKENGVVGETPPAPAAAPAPGAAQAGDDGAPKRRTHPKIKMLIRDENGRRIPQPDETPPPAPASAAPAVGETSEGDRGAGQP